jgi:hypothetical protein
MKKYTSTAAITPAAITLDVKSEQKVHLSSKN